MKKLFAIAVLGLVLVSCKKSSSGGPFISATISDTSSTFTTLFVGDLENGGKEAELYAYNGTKAATARGFYIDIWSNTALTTGVYSDTAGYYPLPTVYKGAYAENYPETYPSVGIDYDFSTIGLVSNPFTVTVTSITPTSIQGTFKGTLFLDNDSTSNTDSLRVITNGKFNSTLVLN